MRGDRVLVTGGHGFLGRAVCRELKQRGYEPYAASSRGYDLRLTAYQDAALRDSGWPPEMMIHLAAAVGGIQANANEPARFMYDNAAMGFGLLERARVFGVEKVLVVGTACAYPNDAPLPLHPDDIWMGYPAGVTAPYGLTKRMLYEMGIHYRRQYGFDVVHVIPSNLYGPNDHFVGAGTHVIPALISRFAAAPDGDLVTIWGTGAATRDFLYVDDAARGICDVLEVYSGETAVNLGSGRETSVKQLAETLVALEGRGHRIAWDASRPDGAARRLLDIETATALGWRPEVDLTDGLQRTLTWYRG